MFTKNTKIIQTINIVQIAILFKPSIAEAYRETKQKYLKSINLSINPQSNGLLLNVNISN